MGAAESGLHEEEEFPYFQMIQWACDELEELNVMTYDLPEARKAIQQIPDDEQALMDADASSVSILKCYEGADREIWEDWAERLLETSESLRDLRYKLVPKKLSEQDFWRKYFARAKQVILATINTL